MRFKNCLFGYINQTLLEDKEAMSAVEEFLKNIPGRVLDMEFDNTKTNKTGVVDGDKVYKLGVNMEESVCFIEFFENRNQGEPSMTLMIFAINPKITVKGWTVDRKFYLNFSVVGGKVEKASKLI